MSVPLARSVSLPVVARSPVKDRGVHGSPASPFVLRSSPVRSLKVNGYVVKNVSPPRQRASHGTVNPANGGTKYTPSPELTRNMKHIRNMHM